MDYQHKPSSGGGGGGNYMGSGLSSSGLNGGFSTFGRGGGLRRGSREGVFSPSNSPRTIALNKISRADQAGGGDIDWVGVTNASLNVLGGVGEMIVGGTGEYFSAGIATPVCVPLIIDGGVRVASNSARLVAYFSGYNDAGNSIPGNAGAWVGKGIDMATGKSFYDYGLGQGLGGAANDFLSFIVTGGTAGSISNMVNNPTLMNGVWYMSAYGGYINSMFYNLYPLRK